MIELCPERVASMRDPVLVRCHEDEAAPGLARCLDRAVRLGYRNVLVDLGARSDADASVLGELYGAARRLRDAGGRLAVICPTPSVRRLLDITLLSQAFSVHSTHAEAIEEAVVTSTVERAR